MTSSTLRRPALRLRALLAGLLAVLGLAAAGATAEPARAAGTPLTFTFSTQFSQQLDAAGVWVLPLSPATVTSLGSGSSHRIRVTLPPSSSDPNGYTGGVWFIRPVTARNTSITAARTEPGTTGPSLTGAFSSKQGARGDWFISSGLYPGSLGGGATFMAELSTVAGRQLRGDVYNGNQSPFVADVG